GKQLALAHQAEAARRPGARRLLLHPLREAGERRTEACGAETPERAQTGRLARALRLVEHLAAQGGQGAVAGTVDVLRQLDALALEDPRQLGRAPLEVDGADPQSSGRGDVGLV